MAIRRILREQEPALYKVCRPVDNINGRIQTLIDDLLDTMYRAEGCGLAASQVGVLRRVFVVDCGEGPVAMINPEIVSVSGEQGDMEGCLSFPGESGYVVRPDHVIARAQNREGEWVEYEATGLFARAILHENDHLDGKVYKRLVTEPPEGFLEARRAEEEQEEQQEQEKEE